MSDGCFWHYQFQTCAEVRRWLHEWSQEGYGHQDLTTSDINWMMQLQGNEHILLKWTCSACGEWWIKKGNYITLAEMLYFGGRTCSCFDLYRANVSNAGGATKRRNAKGLRFQQSGKWGLPLRF